MNKVTLKEYELAVREARQYVVNYSKTRWKICDIANRVCDVSKGGRKTPGIYSIKRFAIDIEINPHTLYEWMRIKKLVYDKLPAAELKDKSKYNFDDLRLVTVGITEKTPKAVVLKKWRDQLAHPREHLKFIKYAKHLDTLIYNAQIPLNMTLVEKHYIEKVISKCDLVSKLLKKELELRERFSTEERVRNKHLKIKKGIKEVFDTRSEN